jgi:hypothetical protein
MDYTSSSVIINVRLPVFDGQRSLAANVPLSLAVIVKTAIGVRQHRYVNLRNVMLTVILENAPHIGVANVFSIEADDQFSHQYAA